MSEPEGVALPHLSDEELLDYQLALVSGQELDVSQQQRLVDEVYRQNGTIQRLSGAVVHLQREDDAKNTVLYNMSVRLSELEDDDG